MNPKSITAVRILALAGSILLVGSVNSFGAFANLPSPTDETPGVLLDAPDIVGFAGTVLAVYDSPFVDNASPTPFASGILRSFVVDRDPTGGVALDYYYQLVNTSIPSIPADPDQEFFRLKTTGGFDPSLIVSVAQTTSISGLIAGVGSGFAAGSYTVAGLKPATTADRDVGTLGSVGFDFPVQPPVPFTDDPKNIAAGQTSSFLVVRTNSSTFGLVETRVSGAATSFASAFAAVPEPSSALFGLALLGTALTRRRKQS